MDNRVCYRQHGCFSLSKFFLDYIMTTNALCFTQNTFQFIICLISWIFSGSVPSTYSVLQGYLESFKASSEKTETYE